MLRVLCAYVLFYFLLYESYAFTAHREKDRNQISPLILTTPSNVTCSTPMCEGDLSPIYCHGEIISAAWFFGLQKSCPGTKLRIPAKDAIELFRRYEYPLHRDNFTKFCGDAFEEISYLEAFQPPDLPDQPPNIERITDLNHRKFFLALHKKWDNLTRKFTKDVFMRPELYPVMPVANHFVVPGGRFQVYFYWDSYWINKGLLLSGMNVTVRGIIDNFAELIHRNGFIHNSGNLQLSKRSQPPLFIQMVKDYYEATGDKSSLKKWMRAMELELQFWNNLRSVKLEDDLLYRYQASTNCPRPESYAEDLEVAENVTNPQATWQAIATACESGWDFSSRWLQSDGQSYKRSSIRANSIIPLDLNVFMVQNYYAMYEFSKIINDDAKLTQVYLTIGASLQETIQRRFWNETEGSFFDLDLNTTLHRTAFFPSNVYPLMLPNMKNFAPKINAYLKKIKILDYPGGIPSTVPVSTTEQWDFPNVWAPSQHLFVNSLLASGDSESKEIALKQAEVFVTTTFNGLLNPTSPLPGGMWEKYDARSSEGKPGGGGEYVVQEGFGWTNGAVMDLIWTLQQNSDSPAETKEIQFLDATTILEAFPHKEVVTGIVVVLLILALGFAICGLIQTWMRNRRNRILEDRPATAQSLDGAPLLANEDLSD